jgi:serine phosphatase RsbU (regulator of sigma subunit)
MRIRSVMCAPLCVPDREPLGVLVIDTQSAQDKFQAEDLQIITAVANQAAVVLEIARAHEDSIKQERIERELNLAREVQRAFLPKNLHSGPALECWAFYESAGAVGGDYYDFIGLPENKLAILLGDVSGKGVPAALLMAKASSDAKVALMTHPNDLDAAVCQLNNAICDANLEGRFMTLAICAIVEGQPPLEIVNAGHMSPMIRRTNGTIDEPAGPEQSGVPIGIMSDFPFQKVVTQWSPGDFVVIYSDGISEAMNKDSKEFTTERIRSIVAAGAKSAAELGNKLLDEVRSHVAGWKQHDDMTLVIFHWR